LSEAIAPTIYPLISPRLAPRQIFLVTRENGSLKDRVQSVRQAIGRADPAARVTVEPLAARVTSQVALARIGGIVLSALSGFTLLLMCLGTAATVAQVGAERQREFAIRDVLGASPRSVLMLMMRVITFPTGAGISLGGLISWWSLPLVSPLLFETSPLDPRSWCAGITTLLITTWLAVWIPARRIRAVEPATLLREE
jgi:putative ABC transport system permease protein